VQLNYSSLVDRVGGRMVAAWDIHYEALAAARPREDVIVLSVGDQIRNTRPDRRSGRYGLARWRHTLHPHLWVSRTPSGNRAEHERISGQHVRPENTIFTAGAQNALSAVALALLERATKSSSLSPCI